jgi:lipid A 3-O-deacylase
MPRNVADRLSRRSGRVALPQIALVLLLAGAPTAPAAAQPPWLDEIKVGVLANDIALFERHVEAGTDVNFEMLFTPPEIFKPIGSPRPDVGVTINSAGDTQSGYFGLTWGIALIQRLFGPSDSVWANGSVGGAVHNGFVDDAPPGRKNLGSPVLFHLSLELGYQASPTTSLSLFIEHMSNANLAPQNDGMTDAGARIGFKF